MICFKIFYSKNSQEGGVITFPMILVLHEQEQHQPKLENSCWLILFFMCSSYDTKLYLMVSLYFQRSKESEVLVCCHYYQVYSHLKYKYLLGSIEGWNRSVSKVFLFDWTMIKKKLLRNNFTKNVDTNVQWM